jgi:hypothetical protein
VNEQKGRSIVNIEYHRLGVEVYRNKRGGFNLIIRLPGNYVFFVTLFREGILKEG